MWRANVGMSILVECLIDSRTKRRTLTDNPDNGPGLALLGNSYGEIRRIARALVSSHQAGKLLQPTELVHEATLRMLRIDGLRIRDEGHLLALAARIMRQALIDEMRRAYAAKRQQPALLTSWPGNEATEISLDALDEAVERLTAISPEYAEIVELRFTLGMTVEEVAVTTGLSERTVKRRWQAARAWLQRHLADEHLGD